MTLVLMGLCLGGIGFWLVTSHSDRGTDEAKAKLETIAQSIENDYTIPVASAGAQVSVICEDTVPDPGKNPQCGQYVEVLRTRTGLLENDIAELQSMRIEVAGSSPLPSNPFDLLIDTLTVVHDNDEAMIQAWDNGDAAAWRVAWMTLKSMPTPNFGQFATPR